MQLNDDASAASFDKPDDALSDTDDIPTRPTTPSFNALQERLHELSANRDEVKIAAQQEVVNRLQVCITIVACAYLYSDQSSLRAEIHQPHLNSYVTPQTTVSHFCL